MADFKGKVVIVTGAGTGIGAATARRFAADGASVVLAGRRADKLTELAGSLPSDRVLVHATDVARQADCDASSTPRSRASASSTCSSTTPAPPLSVPSSRPTSPNTTASCRPTWTA